MMGYEKHTDKELLSECRNCIGDLLNELGPVTIHLQGHLKARALRDELLKRVKTICPA